jgi:hypothetical protein
MADYKFNNGQNNVVNLAGLIDKLHESFVAARALEGRISNRQAPMHNNISIILIFYFASGAGQMFGMSAEEIDSGLMMYLNKYNDADAICAKIVELCRNPRFQKWEAITLKAVENYLDTSDPIFSMSQITKEYYAAID